MSTLPAANRLALHRLIYPLILLLFAACSTSTPPPIEGAGENTQDTYTAADASTNPDVEPPQTPQTAADLPPADPADSESEVEPAENAVPFSPEKLPSDQLDEGWISLFDGQTLFGWTPTSQADWRVENGAIVVGVGSKGLLCTNSQFSDYVLRLEFRSAKGTNSGIFLHTPLDPQDVGSDCYELNIADADNPFPTGSLVHRQKAEGDFESVEWQAYEVTLQGGRVTVDLDGKRILEYTDPTPLLRGPIGLQLNQGEVAFRNIRLKPLGTVDLFNGKDLSGWKAYPEMASRFTAEEGLLHVADGKGQLETEGSYGDFLLQLQCKTHAARLNSGIFFRCIPGDVMMGYECQIQNGYENDDRSQPQDCGTGGFFRRQDARYVAADDLGWFHMTLIADGPHMAAWVDGIQVSDWTDERPANENPRRGLRVDPGTIMIQGHDPTTDISFRGLRIAEMPSASE